MPGSFVKALTATGRTGLTALVFVQVFPDHDRLGFTITALHIRDDALKGMSTPDDPALAVQVFKYNFLGVAAVQDHLSYLFIQLVKRRINSKPIVPGERFDQLKVICITPVPAAYGTIGQAQGTVLDDLVGIKKLDDAKAVTTGTGTDGIIKRK